MTPRFIGPAFIKQHTNYKKIVTDFVDIFWYFSPFISMDSICFLSNRLAGIPGHYMTEEERQNERVDYEQHRGYIKYFNREKTLNEMYGPKCYIYTMMMGWRHKLITGIVVHIFDKYLASKISKRFWNSIIWFGQFCVRQLKFVVDQSLGFKSSYVSFWTRRNAMMKDPQLDDQNQDDLWIISRREINKIIIKDQVNWALLISPNLCFHYLFIVLHL